MDQSDHRLVLPAIALGGMLGASARYGIDLAWPASASTFPWGTFWVNVSGCLLLGVLMVLVTERGARHPLWRPFLGVGVLGGFTTFSTYAVHAQQALEAGLPALAVTYLVATLVGALTAVTLGIAATRLLVP